jgi:hypothetical protein
LLALEFVSRPDVTIALITTDDENVMGALEAESTRAASSIDQLFSKASVKPSVRDWALAHPADGAHQPGG